MTFSGPNLTIKIFIQSNIRSKNWITTEKVNRLNKRERTPKAISIIANAIDLYLIDHDTLPSNLNELIIKNYISMEAPPLMTIHGCTPYIYLKKLFPNQHS